VDTNCTMCTMTTGGHAWDCPMRTPPPAAPAEPEPVAPVDGARDLLDALVDIYFDSREHPPGEGAYVSGALHQTMTEARAWLAAPPARAAAPADAWQPIETAPASGYMLVHEDGAIRALLRHADGRWEAPTYPALVTIVPPGMEHAEHAMVGAAAARFLRPHGLRLALRDGCCENPTHWMPLPDPPAAPPPAQAAEEPQR